EPATFGQFAVNADPGQPLSPYDPADAIYTAAAMLCANGARGGSPAGLQDAVFAYNHAQWYVSEVMAWAAKYATQGGSHAAAIAIAFALAQLGKPYQWGAAGPGAYDCSGLVYAAYAAAGIHIARTTYQWQQDGPAVPLSQIQPGDLLFSAGSDGTASDPGHVVMYLGNGQVIQAPQAGQDVQTGPAGLASVIVATRPAALAARGLARYQMTGASPDPGSRDFGRHVTASARWLLSACESLDGVLATEGTGSLPDPDEPGAALCRAARTVILAWRQPSGTGAD